MSERASGPVQTARRGGNWFVARRPGVCIRSVAKLVGERHKPRRVAPVHFAWTKGTDLELGGGGKEEAAGAGPAPPSPELVQMLALLTELLAVVPRRPIRAEG